MNLMYRIIQYIALLLLTFMLLLTSTLIVSRIVGEIGALQITSLLLMLAVMFAWEFKEYDLLSGLISFLEKY